MKTSINWLLFHLAVADLLVAVLFIHPCILSHFIEIRSYWKCTVQVFFQWVLGLDSGYHFELSVGCHSNGTV